MLFTDVVYDSTNHASMSKLLHALLNNPHNPNPVKMILASTLRNLDTYSTFLESLSKFFQYKPKSFKEYHYDSILRNSLLYVVIIKINQTLPQWLKTILWSVFIVPLFLIKTLSYSKYFKAICSLHQKRENLFLTTQKSSHFILFVKSFCW